MGEELSGRIFSTVLAWGDMTFAELIRHFPEAKGGETMWLNGEMNLVLWSGLSHDFIEALDGLIRAGRLRLMPADLLAYAAGGVALGLPIARQVRRYAEPRWMPVSLKAVRR